MFRVDETLVGDCCFLKACLLRRRDARWRVQLQDNIYYLTTLTAVQRMEVGNIYVSRARDALIFVKCVLRDRAISRPRSPPGYQPPLSGPPQLGSAWARLGSAQARLGLVQRGLGSARFGSGRLGSGPARPGPARPGPARSGVQT